MPVPYNLLSVAPAGCIDLSVRHAENKVQKVGVFFSADLSPQKHHVFTTTSPRLVHEKPRKNAHFSQNPTQKRAKKKLHAESPAPPVS
jgi:hypothetical protein